MTYDDLDDLLAFLFSKGTKYTNYRDIVSEHYKNDETNYDIEGMLIKLDKDGHLDTGQHHSSQKFGWTDQTTYKLSFEGRFFYEAGGYKTKRQNDSLQIEAIKSDLKARNRNEHRLVNGTWFVGFGAVLLVLWEVVKYFCLERH
jgi:hypothetical protein